MAGIGVTLIHCIDNNCGLEDQMNKVNDQTYALLES